MQKATSPSNTRKKERIVWFNENGVGWEDWDNGGGQAGPWPFKPRKFWYKNAEFAQQTQTILIPVSKFTFGWMNGPSLLIHSFRILMIPSLCCWSNTHTICWHGWSHDSFIPCIIVPKRSFNSGKTIQTNAMKWMRWVSHVHWTNSLENYLQLK